MQLSAAIVEEFTKQVPSCIHSSASKAVGRCVQRNWGPRRHGGLFSGGIANSVLRQSHMTSIIDICMYSFQIKKGCEFLLAVMAKFIGSTAHMGLAVPAWILAFCGFAILLGGIAGMQKSCGGTPANTIVPPGMAAVGYLAAVP